MSWKPAQERWGASLRHEQWSYALAASLRCLPSVRHTRTLRRPEQKQQND
jgi:hypothetical protein